MVNSSSSTPQTVATPRRGPAGTGTRPARARCDGAPRPSPHHPLQVGAAVDAVAAGLVERLVEAVEGGAEHRVPVVLELLTGGPLPHRAAERGGDGADHAVDRRHLVLQRSPERSQLLGVGAVHAHRWVLLPGA